MALSSTDKNNGTVTAWQAPGSSSIAPLFVLFAHF